MEINPKIITLYRYYVCAVQTRLQFSMETTPDWFKMMSNDWTSIVLFFYSAPGIYLSYSYAGIYLVIEGWKELKLKDEKIDNLISSPFVDRLRLFRNATFHYQKDPISSKLIQFFGTEEEKTEKWLNELYYEFGRYFQENSLTIPPQLKEQLEGKNHAEIALTIQKYWKELDNLTETSNDTK